MNEYNDTSGKTNLKKKNTYRPLSIKTIFDLFSWTCLYIKAGMSLVKKDIWI